MSRIRVILADDHTVTREGVRQFLDLQEDIEVVAESADGEETARLTQKLAPDVLVLDISMPGKNGIEVARLIRRTTPETRIIILTGYDNAQYAKALMQLGVQGYLSKTATSREIAAAIRSVYKGEVHFQVPAAALFYQRAKLADDEMPTPRELEVLALVAQGFRNRDVALQLSTTERTVTFHLSNLLAKFRASSRTELIHLARQRGWLS